MKPIKIFRHVGSRVGQDLLLLFKWIKIWSFSVQWEFYVLASFNKEIWILFKFHHFHNILFNVLLSLNLRAGYYLTVLLAQWDIY